MKSIDLYLLTDEVCQILKFGREYCHGICTKSIFYFSKMGLDLVPRVDGVPVDVDKISVVELHKIVSIF